jgi:nucleoside-diphosphate-sugar epimerase
MRILVIGGTDFIGPFVVRRLHEQGHVVTVFHRGRTEADLPAAIGHLHGDRRRLADFAADLRRVGPEVVLDMFAMTEPDAQVVMQTVRGLARRVVTISSLDVYRAYDIARGRAPGPPDPIPLGEDAPLRSQLYPYRDETPRQPDDPNRAADDYEKILVERAVLGDAALSGTVLRLPMVYGPGDSQHRLFPYLKRMDDGRPAILLDAGLAGMRASRGYVENVAAAIALAVVDDRAAGRIYNVGEADAPTEADWVRRVGAAAGWRGMIVAAPPDRVPAHLTVALNTAQHWAIDTTRLRRELGYREPIPLDGALRRAVAWERAHPPAATDPTRFDYAAEDAALAALRRRQ